MQEQIAKDTKVYTDEAAVYVKTNPPVASHFESHDYVRHSNGEYVRGKIHTNTIEGYFSILKRGLVGTYHHVGKQHLRRYVGEFDFRYNNRHISDVDRADKALKGIAGKRLMYGGACLLKSRANS